MGMIEQRSSHQMCSMKEALINSFAIFTGKHQCGSLFLIKLPCKYCKFFHSTYFEEHLRAAISIFREKVKTLYQETW